MIDEMIVRRFEAAAATYDREAGIQRTVARDLLALCSPDAGTVLELGCGAGGYTRLLCEALPAAGITAIDAAEAMVRSAKSAAWPDRVRFLVADLRTFRDRRPYDLVTANAVLHWIPNLDNVLSALADRVAPGGSLTFSHFGPGTYRELRAALSRTVGADVAIASSAFATAGDLDRMLRRRFATCRVDVVEYEEEFRSLHALLANIRATGTRGAGAALSPPFAGDRIAWTPGLLRRVEERYRADFGAIRVSYQVSLCRAGNGEWASLSGRHAHSPG